MAPSKEPVLSLSTLAPDRPIIEIDDTHYEIAVTGDLGLVESHKLDALQPSMLAFSEIKGPPSQDALEEVADTLKSFVALIVLECDESVIDKLNDGQRMAIVNVVTNAAALSVKKEANPAKKKRTTTRKT